MSRMFGRDAPRSETARMLRGSGFIFGCRLTGAGFTFLSQVLLARTIGASDLGIYALAFAWCLLLANLSTLGFIPAAMRFVGKSQAEHTPGYARGFIGFASRVTLGSTLVAALGLCLTALFWLPEGSLVRQPLLIASGVVPLLAGLHLLGGFGSAYANFSLGFLPTSVFRPGLFCLFIVLAALIDVELNADIAMLLAALAVVVVSLPTFAISARFVASKVAAARPVSDPSWLRTSSALLVPALFTGYFPEVIVIVAGAVLASSELAVLHVCLRLSTLVSFGLLAVDTFVGPDIARQYAQGNLATLQRTVTRATRLRFWGSLLATAAFAVAGVPVLELFGSEFAVGYPILLILVVGQLVQGSVGPVVRLVGISNHQDRALIVFAVSLVACIPLTLLLARVFGAIGAAVAVTFVTAGWGIWMRRLVIGLIGVTPRPF